MWRVVGMLCLLCATAAAQPGVYPTSFDAPPERHDRFFFALGAVVGGGGTGVGHDWLYGGWTAELAVTLLRAPLPVRARAFGVLYGGTIESDWSGDFSRVGAGLEGRWCTGGLGTCLFADLDVGYQRLTMNEESGIFVRSDKGLIAGPRFGLDVGGALRLRFALEAYRHFAHHTTTRDTSYDAYGTIGLSLVLGYQL